MAALLFSNPKAGMSIEYPFDCAFPILYFYTNPIRLRTLNRA